jgi:hypothetical protein
MTRPSTTLLAALPLLLPCAAPAQEQDAAEAALAAELETAGITLERAAGVCSVPGHVLVRDDLLEYLLVGPNGAGHESLFLTEVRPSLLNAALLLLGVQVGTNARMEELDEVDERGRPVRIVHPPEGDGFYLYAGWREGDEVFFYRVEDLVRNLERGSSLERHRWVYLGSRFQALQPDQPEAVMADVEGNLIALSVFFQGNTLLTARPEECMAQTIWAANEWLLPPLGQPVRLFFARAPLAEPPAGHALPVADRDAEPRRPGAPGNGAR